MDPPVPMDVVEEEESEDPIKAPQQDLEEEFKNWLSMSQFWGGGIESDKKAKKIWGNLSSEIG